MKKFLVSYAFEPLAEGDGPIYAFVLAESSDAISAAYPEVEVVTDWPEWLTPDGEAALDVFDLGYRGPGLLRIVRHDRGDYRA